MWGPNVGLSFAGLASLALGVYLFAIKRYVDHYPATVYVTLTYASSLLWYVPIAVLTVDGGFVPTRHRLAALAVLAFVVAGSALAVLASFRAIAVGEVSYVAPIGKLVPVFVVPVEVAVFGQHLTALQLSGVAVATGAVYVANYERGALLRPLARARRAPDRPSSRSRARPPSA